MTMDDYKHTELILEHILSDDESLAMIKEDPDTLRQLLVEWDSKQPALDPVFRNFGDQFIKLHIGGKSVIASRDNINEWYEPRAFDEHFSQKKIIKHQYNRKKTEAKRQVDENASAEYDLVEIKAAPIWRDEHAERFDKAVFRPAGKCQPYEFNYWKGWSYHPDNTGSWDLFQTHIRDIICSGNDEIYDFLLDWMAQTIQQPERKVGIAVAIHGRQGTGKSFFVKRFAELFGDAYYELRSVEDLTGRFNSPLVNNLLVFADEAIWGGDKKSWGAIKRFITDDKISIEFKNRDVVMMDNFARLIIATNEYWAAPVEHSDRRYLVLEVSDSRANDRQYFKAIDQQLRSGGYEAMLSDLMERDITGRDWSKIPETETRVEQKIRGMTIVEKYIYLSLSGEMDDDESLIGAYVSNRGDWVPGTEIFDRFREFYIKDYPKGYPKGRKEFSMEMQAILQLKKQRMSVGGKKNYYYFIGDPSEMRASFDRHMGTHFDWSMLDEVVHGDVVVNRSKSTTSGARHEVVEPEEWEDLQLRLPFDLPFEEMLLRAVGYSDPTEEVDDVKEQVS